MPNDEILKKLGQQIARIRKDKGLTQIKLSYMCDIERANLARIEAGNTNPTFLTLLSLAKALEIPLIELIDIE